MRGFHRDRVALLFGYIRKYPVVAAASAAFIAVSQRRGLLKWGQRALVMWRAWSALRSRRVI